MEIKPQEQSKSKICQPALNSIANSWAVSNGEALSSDRSEDEVCCNFKNYSGDE